MCKEGIPILDVYYMTASYPIRPPDGVHYGDHVFETAASAFESFVLDHSL